MTHAAEGRPNLTEVTSVRVPPGGQINHMMRTEKKCAGGL